MNLFCFRAYYLLLKFSLKKFVHFWLNFDDFYFYPFEYNAAVCAVTRWCTTPRFASCFRSYWAYVPFVCELITRKNLPPFGFMYYIWAWKGISFNFSRFTFSFCKSSSFLSWYSNDIFEFTVAIGISFNNTLPSFLRFSLFSFLNSIALCNMMVILTLTPTTSSLRTFAKSSANF